MSPAIVLSLDFELRWGGIELFGDDMSLYRQNLEGVEDVVPRLLDAFAARGVCATWAIVGALACRNWDEWSVRAPARPHYHNPKLRWRDSYRTLDPTGRLHFARHLVDSIVRTDGQELASHTFGHIYIREAGFLRKDAVADTDAMAQLFEDNWSMRPRSLVFPRNQVGHTDVFLERGIVCWRENPHAFYWNASRMADQTPVVRALRFTDSVAPLGRRIAVARAHRASYFLRLTLPPALWRLHRRRIVAEARKLKDDEALHLWFHPHNIGAAPEHGVARVAELLDAVHFAAPPSTRFMSMGDIATATGA